MSVRKRKDGKWQHDIVIWRGKERIRDRGACKGARNRSEALAFERARRAELEGGAPTGDVAAITFAEHAEEVMRVYVAVENKHSEQISKRSILDLHLLPAFGSSTLDEIDELRIARFKASKLRPDPPAKPLSGKTVNNMLLVLSKFLVLAKLWKRIKSVPAIGFVKVKPSGFDFLTFSEAAQLLDAARADGFTYALILTGLRAGLRVGELLELRWDDLDLAKGLIRIQRAIYDGAIDTPKGGKTREVPMGDELRSVFKTMRRVRGALVFPRKDGRHLTRGQCRHLINKACDRASLRRVGSHVLRHTFASHLVMRGVPLKVVQELLGHVKMDTTMKYAHLAPECARDAVKLLDGPAPSTGEPAAS